MQAPFLVQFFAVALPVIVVSATIHYRYGCWWSVSASTAIAVAGPRYRSALPCLQGCGQMRSQFHRSEAIDSWPWGMQGMQGMPGMRQANFEEQPQLGHGCDGCVLQGKADVPTVHCAV